VIVISPYDPAWPERFSVEALLVREALGEWAVRIDHVGSTSVPGLDAKPVIDIQISVPSLEPLARTTDPLARAGYTYIRDPDEAFDRVYPFFRKPAHWPSSHHIHACRAGSEEERRHLAFRDYLRDHSEAAAEYLELKRRLATLHVGTTPESRESYAMAKSDFVAAVTERAYELGYPKL
jgi:GrpB-like predicted nucleotidyltransferase (UPF0157 family)